MIVYLIPKIKRDLWVCDRFNPVQDVNGNYVVAVNTDYSQYSFNNELMQCEQIDYVPPINEVL